MQKAISSTKTTVHREFSDFMSLLLNKYDTNSRKAEANMFLKIILRVLVCLAVSRLTVANEHSKLDKSTGFSSEALREY